MAKVPPRTRIDPAIWDTLAVVRRLTFWGS